MSGGFTRPWRWLPVAVLAIVVLGIQGRTSRAAPSRVRAAPSRLMSCPASVHSLGKIALVASGRLEVIDLARCRVSVVRAAGVGEVRFSPDGRWLAYSPFVAGSSSATGPVVVRALRGGPSRSPMGKGIVDWAWAPAGALLYGLTDRGSLVAAPPDGPRRVVASNLGSAFSLAISPDGADAAVDNSTCAPASTGELDTVNLRTGARTVAIRRPGESLTLAGWSPDGRWLLFWAATMCSASLAADGWPLYAVAASGGSPVKVVPHMLLYDDFLSWCGSALIAAAGPDRETEIGSKLLSVAPSGWRVRTLQRARALSWVSPSCAPGGRLLAVAAGRSHEGVFGLEHRSIWLLRGDTGARVRRLPLPATVDLSDEAPRFSRDGRWILFVRTKVVANGSRDTIELVRARGGVAIPTIDFTSGDSSYYDHFEWPYAIDWYQSR